FSSIVLDAGYRDDDSRRCGPFCTHIAQDEAAIRKPGRSGTHLASDFGKGRQSCCKTFVHWIRLTSLNPSGHPCGESAWGDWRCCVPLWLPQLWQLNLMRLQLQPKS